MNVSDFITATHLNQAGIIVGILGTALLFMGTPRDTPDIPPTRTPPIEEIFSYPMEYREKERKRLRKRAIRSRFGVGCLTVAYGLQLIATFL